MIRQERLNDIVDGLLHDASFPCHKTIDCRGESPLRTGNTRECFGGTLLLEKIAVGGCRSNVLQRLSIMQGNFSLEDLRIDDSVIDFPVEVTE